MRLLLVEDDPGVAAALREALELNGWEVVHRTRGDDGLRQLAGADVVVLDLGLPDMDGIEVLRVLRKASDVPVLVLTARDSDGAVVRGLGAGADDYLVKPISSVVLQARLRALLRRAGHRGRAGSPPTGAEVEPAAELPADSASTDRRVLRRGDLVIDLRSRQAARGGTQVPLTPTELDVLAVLAEHPGEAVSREQIHLSVWGTPLTGGSRSLDFFVAHLRSKLGPDLGLETVRGFGYRLQPDGEG